MKILAVTDVHGSYKKVEDILSKEKPDILIIGGDLTTAGTSEEAEEAIKRFSKLCKKILCITGNMDLPQHDKLFDNLGLSLNGRGVVIDIVGFFGVSGSPYSPLRTPNEVSEEEINRKIFEGYLQIEHADKRILVTHTPPYGTKVDVVHSGIHVGSKAVREFVEIEKPDMVICGHVHESKGQDIIGKTKIVNCGAASNGYYVIVTTDRNNFSINNLTM